MKSIISIWNTLSTLFAVFGILGGAANLLFGYHLLLYWAGTIGFFSGLFFGGVLGFLLLGPKAAIILGLILGLMGIPVNRFFHVAGPCFLGGFTGAALGFLTTLCLVHVVPAALLVSFPILSGILGGALGFKFERPFFIVSTAFSGAFGVVVGVTSIGLRIFGTNLIKDLIHGHWSDWLLSLAFLLFIAVCLGIFGVNFQFNQNFSPNRDVIAN